MSKRIKKIDLKSTKVLQASHIRKALLHPVETWDQKTKSKAFLDTDGGL